MQSYTTLPSLLEITIKIYTFHNYQTFSKELPTLQYILLQLIKFKNNCLDFLQANFLRTFPPPAHTKSSRVKDDVDDYLPPAPWQNFPGAVPPLREGGREGRKEKGRISKRRRWPWKEEDEGFHKAPKLNK